MVRDADTDMSPRCERAIAKGWARVAVQQIILTQKRWLIQTVVDENYSAFCIKLGFPLAALAAMQEGLEFN